MKFSCEKCSFVQSRSHYSNQSRAHKLYLSSYPKAQVCQWTISILHLAVRKVKVQKKKKKKKKKKKYKNVLSGKTKPTIT